MDNYLQESYPQRVLHDMSAAVLVLDRKGRIMYLNRPAADMLELDDTCPPGTQRFQLTSDNTENDEFYEYIFAALYQKQETHVGQVKYRSPSGKLYHVRISSSYLSTQDIENSEIVLTISDETQEFMLQQKVHDSATTFTTFLFGFSIWMILYALWEFLGRPIASDFLTHGIEVLSVIMLIFILHRTSLTWRDLGCLPENPKKTVKTGVIVALAAVGLLFAAKAVARMIDPGCFEPSAPFFDISRFGVRQVLYILTAGIQEFLARSVMQGNLRRILVSRHRGVMAIILSSLVFAALHIHFGFVFMIGAAILAGLEGILYEKQQNIVGVWIVHWAFGVCATLLCLIDH